MGSERTSEVEQREDQQEHRDTPSILGRLLIGGFLGFTALENFRGMEGQIGYAEAKGAPYPELLVPFSSGMLAAGSLGIVLWRLPVAATGAVASFLLGVTPIMHDFWNVDDEQQKQVELYQFVKNVVILGAMVELFRQGIQRER
jgi:uncharacterized membrane protein YphA (DoxX/SURF4 family)